MRPASWSQSISRVLAATVLLLAGCAKTLVKDDIQQPATGLAHCAGDEWADNSSLAALPIPVVAFFVPHFDLNEIRADDYLKRCGDSTKLINREVKVSKNACIPAALTRIISLGIWQWCPANVAWRADIKA